VAESTRGPVALHQCQRAIQSSTCGASAAMVVESPWPVCTTVSPGTNTCGDGRGLSASLLRLTALRFTVVKRINCVCGSVVEGDDDNELWERAQQHLDADHPDLAGKVSREDIMAQAEEI
jgi:hypothetical protein